MRKVGGDHNRTRWGATLGLILLDIIFRNPRVALCAHELDGDLQERHGARNWLQVTQLLELVVGHGRDVAKKGGAEHVESEI